MTPHVNDLLEKIAEGSYQPSADIKITDAVVREKPVRFATNVDRDPIQRRHRRGKFYEPIELNAIATVFPKGGVFVDIGANVGNHGLFAALYLGASKVVPIEPNPQAYELLLHNVVLNNLQEQFDLTKIGVGMADEDEEGYSVQQREVNLGGAKMRKGDGDIRVFKGDTLFADLTPDFLKIDVEVMEMQVLAGLKETIAKHRPSILIEIHNRLAEPFAEWMEANEYEPVQTIPHYKHMHNYLLLPKK